VQSEGSKEERLDSLLFVYQKTAFIYVKIHTGLRERMDRMVLAQIEKEVASHWWLDWSWSAGQYQFGSAKESR